ncbi:S1 RNA-binding domain-containing protein [Schlesneria sp.]|uniref:S1 RNA-binding domain-containing protein n=1 Tax=Schlesneria sp. TaxID=2762018 RepID=UPI002EFE87A6
MNGDETMVGDAQTPAAQTTSHDGPTATPTSQTGAEPHVGSVAGQPLTPDALSAAHAAVASASADTLTTKEATVAEPVAAVVTPTESQAVSSATDAPVAAMSSADAPASESTPTSETAAATGEEARKKPVLNPDVSGQSSRAVGSIGAEVESEAATLAAAAAAQAQTNTASGPIGHIELPPKQVALDDSLEKEIEAAMSGQMTSPTAPPAGAVTPTSSAIAEELPASEDQLEAGTKLKAKVQSVTADDVFCEVGYRSPGLLPARQFPQGKQPRVGEEFLVIVEKYDPENSVILVNLPKATRKARGNWDELTVGQVTECIVNKTNKGGLEVTVGGLRAFLPASQVDLGFVSSMDALVGQKLTVQITELNPAKRNLVVSRRSVMIAERKELAVAFWEKVEVGQQFTGTVKTIKDYGVFIDLGGADGFLHIGEMSWTRVKHPSEVLQEGQKCEVVVQSLDREKQKIGLGMRQLTHNPWGSVETNYAVGKEVTGKVTRTTDFGAFVELEPGVEGLIHISEMDHQRIRKVTDVVNIGQEVQAQVLEVAPDRQRISLSLKALKQKPEKPKDEDLAPGKGEPYERKRKEPLRGGKAMGSSGGLFGNPGDFSR